TMRSTTGCKKHDDLTIVAVCVFCAGLWETEAMSVTGVLGSDVTIKCSHSNAFSNVKYFCKGTCENEDVLISSRTNNNLYKKYSIKDEGNTFYVTISSLEEDDSGMYWCGIERIGLDTYSEVFLTVIKDICSISFFMDNISQHSLKLIFSFSQMLYLLVSNCLVVCRCVCERQNPD
uniref:Ig-like domain-containing protein n=1 Tax=Sander lucioperca TaxID=283035 RepID=A0A8C9XN56_SANLU